MGESKRRALARSAQPIIYHHTSTLRTNLLWMSDLSREVGFFSRQGYRQSSGQFPSRRRSVRRPAWPTATFRGGSTFYFLLSVPASDLGLAPARPRFFFLDAAVTCSAPYWAYHHRHHHRYLTYCEIYPYAYVCRPHHRHHHHDYNYWGDDWGGY